MKKLLSISILFLSVAAFAQTYPKISNEGVAPKRSAAPPAQLKKDGSVMKSSTVKPSKNTGDFQELMERAVVQSKDKKYEAAISLYTQALNVASEDQAWRALVSRATTYQTMDKPDNDKAIRDLTVIIDAQNAPQKQLAYIYTSRGRLLQDKGDVAGACADAQKARELGLPEALMAGFEECK